METKQKTTLTQGSVAKGMLLFADNGERVEIVSTEAPDGEVVC